MAFFQPDTETLLAVILGAGLATAGGFSERQVERLIQKREKERSAALFFGELLSAMRTIMRLANEARAHGDPYGPVTMRFARAVRQEATIYDRNRETMLDLRSAQVRAAISVLIARMTFALDGVLDAHAELQGLDENAPEERRQALVEARKVAFDFAVEAAASITPLLASLAPIARHNFGALESALPEVAVAQPAADEL